MIPHRSRRCGARALRARQTSSQAAGAPLFHTPFERRQGLASGARALQARPAAPTRAGLQISHTGELR